MIGRQNDFVIVRMQTEEMEVGFCIKKMQTAKMYGCKLHTDN
jgi:hypothetical protein